ncbi:MAG: membrane protein insertion efficiency factor YidD [Acidimicrobiales bacterium]|nr:membrane protein insertion efficiency factor YidD [Acidimicrobiales bacterium]MXX42275.1 membrane protein insertion efficiency factor YidD [Acidimicrobiales bacterium]MXZ15101.1 membrane protein insertion efficiency factor YidD [Acidimicrobiales bacterium]MYB80396.1 membrane protein insertion efficiency factor YidD [Acidimicrobiales bacterium]MYD32699.1 membrane protein insertion efficiency factor YidD [Acidimicrobiales bacterium]
MTSGPLTRTLIAAVKLYRALPRSRLPSCRFDPTCSQYALDALRTWGAARGGWLALRRICRCHPWGGWGCDPVPETGDHLRRGHRAVATTGLLEH